MKELFLPEQHNPKFAAEKTFKIGMWHVIVITSVDHVTEVSNSPHW